MALTRRWFFLYKNVALIGTLLVVSFILLDYWALFNVAKSSDVASSLRSQRNLQIRFSSQHVPVQRTRNTTYVPPTAPTSHPHHIEFEPPRKQPALTSIALPTLGNKQRCKHGHLARYGGNFSQPVFIRTGGRKNDHHVSRAFGCSTHHKYCTADIKPIPCCTKIMYDMWYALDKYLTAHRVTYTLRWGSLLMAVRDGRHAVWDSNDLDLGFLYPRSKAEIAIAELLRDYHLHKDGSHHITDWEQTFYVLHHEQYGYPDPEQKQAQHCFYPAAWQTAQAEAILDDPEALILGGTVPFLDYTMGGTKSYGMGNYAKRVDKDRYMLQVEYNGSNGIPPPRKMLVFADYYKHLYFEYGDTWHQGYTFLSEKQLRYYGLPPFDNTYFKTIYNQTIELLDRYEGRWGPVGANHSAYYEHFRNIFA